MEEDINELLRLDNIVKDIPGWLTPMYVQCCVCDRLRLANNSFSHIPPNMLEEIARRDRREEGLDDNCNYVLSHTYCHPCSQKEHDEIRRYRK